MSRNKDIGAFLEDWHYEPGKLSVRKFTGDDGNEKIQLRVDLGILQMNVNGRPDGSEPYGCESVFDYFVDRLEEQMDEKESEFSLKPEDVLELQQEVLQYYHRYICLYEMKEHDLVIRDTTRNLEVIDFISFYAEHGVEMSNFYNLKPQLLMMLAHSHSLVLIRQGKNDEAIKALEDGIADIDDFFEEVEEEIEEPTRELSMLQNLLDDLKKGKPLSKEEILENQMRQAVEKEEYERAAEIRDALKALTTGSGNQ